MLVSVSVGGWWLLVGAGSDDLRTVGLGGPNKRIPAVFAVVEAAELGCHFRELAYNPEGCFLGLVVVSGCVHVGLLGGWWFPLQRPSYTSPD